MNIRKYLISRRFGHRSRRIVWPPGNRSVVVTFPGHCVVIIDFVNNNVVCRIMVFIDIDLASGTDAMIHAETNSGEIDVQVGAGVSYEVQKKDEVRFTLGSGSATLDVGTGSGDIRIRG